MERRSAIALVLLVGFGMSGCSQMPFGGGDAGWITLIDGTAGLDNWNRIGDANWRAEDGAIVADKGKGGYLVSKNSYRDFQITPRTAASSSAVPIPARSAPPAPTR